MLISDEAFSSCESTMTGTQFCTMDSFTWVRVLTKVPFDIPLNFISSEDEDGNIGQGFPQSSAKLACSADVLVRKQRSKIIVGMEQIRQQLQCRGAEITDALFGSIAIGSGRSVSGMNSFQTVASRHCEKRRSIFPQSKVGCDLKGLRKGQRAWLSI
jgi:hypothetical protein